MIKSVLIIAAVILCVQTLHAQPRFFGGIKVEFEKTTSVRQLMKELQEGNSWYEQNKDRYPVSTVNYYDFIGDTVHSIYRPGKEIPIDPRAWYRPVGDKNVVYNDYKTGMCISQNPCLKKLSWWRIA
jgi:hypothetical protein